MDQPLQGRIEHLSVYRQSLLFAELSKIAYFQPAEVESAIHRAGFESYHFLDRDGAQAYIFANRFDCVVICRGTEPHDWNDIKADADAISVLAESVGRVHRGFKKEADDLWPRLERELKAYDQPLWFAGHSLGGAMATICAARCKLAEIPSNPDGLFTYGSPRVGNQRYINFVRLRHYRWVNNNDIVPSVPPMWLGYTHSGQEMYLDANGRYRRFSAWRRWRDRWHGFWLTAGKGRLDHLSDHSIAQYIEYLQCAVDDEAAGKTKSIPGQPIC